MEQRPRLANCKVTNKKRVKQVSCGLAKVSHGSLFQ